MMTNSMSRARGRVIQSILVCFWVLLLGIFAPTGTNTARGEEKRTGAAKAGVQGSDYLIGAGDVLEIVVWREPEISRIVRVRPDGKISLPLVDDVQAADGTLLALKKRLSKALSKFVDEPSVYVMLEENRSKRFHVVGKVNKPGQYILERDVTVLQAIAMAGGFTEWAKKDDIIIVRQGPEGQFRIEFDYEDVVAGKKLDQNIFLKSEDVLVVP